MGNKKIKKGFPGRIPEKPLHALHLFALYLFQPDNAGMLRMAPCFVVLREEGVERDRPPGQEEYRKQKQLQVHSPVHFLHQHRDRALQVSVQHDRKRQAQRHLRVDRDQVRIARHHGIQPKSHGNQETDQINKRIENIQSGIDLNDAALANALPEQRKHVAARYVEMALHPAQPLACGRLERNRLLVEDASVVIEFRINSALNATDGELEVLDKARRAPTHFFKQLRLEAHARAAQEVG